MPVNPSNLLPLRNAIKAQLITEMASGRISTVQAVGDTWLNETTVYPYISVWAQSRSERIEANRRKRSTVHFVIGLAYKSNVSIEDAYDNLYALMDDGQGNGLEAILRDPKYYSWGGLATYSEIYQVQYADNIEADRTAPLTKYVAYAVMQYNTVQLMYWDGPIS